MSMSKHRVPHSIHWLTIIVTVGITIWSEIPTYLMAAYLLYPVCWLVKSHEAAPKIAVPKLLAL